MANATVVEVKKRSEKGSRNLNSLRSEGHVPGIVYGHNEKFAPEMIQLEESKIKRQLEKGNKLFDIKGLDSDVKAIVTEVQVNELNDRILHVDFQRVENGDQLNFKIPLSIKGTPAGAKVGGRLQVFLHDIRIACTTETVIEEFVLDVSPLEVLGRVTLADLDLPEGVSPVGIPTTTVCIVHPPKNKKKKDAKKDEK